MWWEIKKRTHKTRPVYSNRPTNSSRDTPQHVARKYKTGRPPLKQARFVQVKVCCDRPRAPVRLDSIRGMELAVSIREFCTSTVQAWFQSPVGR